MEEKEEKQKLIQKYKEAMRYEHSAFSSAKIPVELGFALKRTGCVIYSYLLPTLPFAPRTVCFVVPVTSVTCPATAQPLGCVPRDCVTMKSVLLVTKAPSS